MKSNTTQDAAVRLMLKFPFWSELYYTMTIYDDPDIPTLCTDGRNMWVNPTFWAGLTLPLKIAALAHEIGHKMLLHSTRRGSRHPELWNIAADYVVNAILAKNGFELGKSWLYDVKYEGMSTEAVYHEIEQIAKQQPQQGKGGNNGQGTSSKAPPSQGGEQGSGDDDQGDGDTGGAGGDDSGQAGDAESDQSQGDSGTNQQGGGNGTYNVPGVSQEWKDKWQDIIHAEGSKEEIEKQEKQTIDQVQKAMMTAKAHGSVPGGMEAFDDVCTPSREPWYNHLHRYMQSLSQSEYNWARINRRHLVQHQIFTPANYSESLEHIVFAIDCSGSVFGAAEQANFAGHVNAILAEAKPNKTHVVYFDSRVTRHDELDYGQLEFSTRPAGGGGTDFRPIFRFLEDEGIVPELCVVLTDCYGDFPKDAPGYPTIWASIVDPDHLGGYHPPFGEVIYVDPDA